MNILSLLAALAGCCFIFMGYLKIKQNPHDMLNRMGLIVEICFAIWAFCYALMYAAPSAADAMMWHKIGSIGWVLFAVYTVQFFLIIYGYEKLIRLSRVQILLCALPFVLLIRNFFWPGTAVVSEMVQSEFGLGWTYVADLKSAWFWLYIAYIVIYFLVFIIIVIIKVRQKEMRNNHKQSYVMIISICLMMLAGISSDFVLSAIKPVLPPICIILLVVWVLFSRSVILRFRLIGIIDATTPDLILRTVMNPILLLNSQGYIKVCNQAFERLVKCDKDKIVDRPLSDFFKSGTYDKFLISKLLREKILRDIEKQFIDSEGKVIQTSATFTIAENKKDGMLGIIVSINDVTELKAIEKTLNDSNDRYRDLSEHLVRLANYDELTRLPNRRMFFNRLESALSEHQRTHESFALVYIDLDGFKSINDNAGHTIGDLVLIEAAQIFQSIVRKNDLVGRVGGDEFVLLLRECGNVSDLEALLNRVREKFNQPMVLNGRLCLVGVSMGVSRCPEDSESIDDLLRLADERMYHEKNQKQVVG